MVAASRQPLGVNVETTATPQKVMEDIYQYIVVTN